MEYGVPKGSVLGQLFFNIDLIDSFFKYENSNAIFANDTTPYTCSSDSPTIISQI